MKIVICTIHNRCLPVLRASVRAYASEHDLLVAGPSGQLANRATNFGDAYNAALAHVFAAEEECIVANDDVVLKPNTMSMMLADVASLKHQVPRLGFVGARSDFVLPAQNVRFPDGPDDRLRYLRWLSETQVKPAAVIAPIFAYLSREAFVTAQFPPLNWYSDNVICADLQAAGYRHFVSRAYVHHAGAQTTGMNAGKLIEAAKPWICANRPAYAKAWFS